MENNAHQGQFAHDNPVVRLEVGIDPEPRDHLVHLSAGATVWLPTEHGQVEIKNLSDMPVFVGSVSLVGEEAKDAP